jgi:transcriptional regulator with XRE-family HTH domain
MPSINPLQSGMRASLLPTNSGNMTSSNHLLVTGVLDRTDILEGFAQRLRKLRKHKNLSQTELGKIAELHYTHIGRFEKGSSRPSGDTLKRLADALGVTSDYLLDGAHDQAAKARFADRDLLRQFQEVEQLPDDDKLVIKKLLDAFLIRKQLQTLAR